jgi:hypothetical protein
MVIGKTMLEGIFGNIIVEKILFTLYIYGEGYPLGMAKTFEEPVNRFQQQLKRLENTGIIVSRLIGRVRVYTFNSSPKRRRMLIIKNERDQGELANPYED